MKVRKSDLASFLAACEMFPPFPWRWCGYRTLTVESLESCFHRAINDISHPCGWHNSALSKPFFPHFGLGRGTNWFTTLSISAWTAFDMKLQEHNAHNGNKRYSSQGNQTHYFEAIHFASRDFDIALFVAA